VVVRWQKYESDHSRLLISTQQLKVFCYVSAVLFYSHICQLRLAMQAFSQEVLQHIQVNGAASLQEDTIKTCTFLKCGKIIIKQLTIIRQRRGDNH
jgi:hypothetical protein